MDLKDIVMRNIKKIRTANGDTQRALADKLNVAIPTVSGWERGSKQPSFDTLDAIAKVYGVPVHKFFVDYRKNSQYFIPAPKCAADVIKLITLAASAEEVKSAEVEYEKPDGIPTGVRLTFSKDSSVSLSPLIAALAISSAFKKQAS